MRLIKTLTLCAALLPLALCAPIASDGCAGWRPVRASAETVDYLASHEPAALKAMISHAEFGHSQKCW